MPRHCHSVRSLAMVSFLLLNLVVRAVRENWISLPQIRNLPVLRLCWIVVAECLVAWVIHLNLYRDVWFPSGWVRWIISDAIQVFAFVKLTWHEETTFGICYNLSRKSQSKG